VALRPANLAFTPASDLTIFEGTAFDSGGCGPYPHVPPCPNCGKPGGYLDMMAYVGLLNSGYDLDGPCSRRCQLQWEHAAKLAAQAGIRSDELDLRVEETPS
jgi:hypothetical protein